MPTPHPLIARLSELHANVLRKVNATADFHDSCLVLMRDLEAFITENEPKAGDKKVSQDVKP